MDVARRQDAAEIRQWWSTAPQLDETGLQAGILQLLNRIHAVVGRVPGNRAGADRARLQPVWGWAKGPVGSPITFKTFIIAYCQWVPDNDSELCPIVVRQISRIRLGELGKDDQQV